MKLKPSRNHLDKINLNIKLFQTIKIPEKNKVICQIQKFINNLGNSIKLLETPNSKKKINNGKFIHPSKSLLIKHKIHKKRKYLLSHSSSKSDINELTLEQPFRILVIFLVHVSLVGNILKLDTNSSALYIFLIFPTSLDGWK